VPLVSSGVALEAFVGFTPVSFVQGTFGLTSSAPDHDWDAMTSRAFGPQFNNTSSIESL
jgi:hypothetical protein